MPSLQESLLFIRKVFLLFQHIHLHQDRQCFSPLAINNNLIIQYGRYGGTVSSVTFPTSFSDTNYSVVITWRNYGDRGAYGTNYTTSTSKTGFTCPNAGANMQYIVVGY